MTGHKLLKIKLREDLHLQVKELHDNETNKRKLGQKNWILMQ
jgi:hypothetical protein